MTRNVKLVLAAALLSVPAVWGWQERAARLDTQRRASAAATLIAGRPVAVRCPGVVRRHVLREVYHGTVRFDGAGRPADETKLAGEPCAGLRRLIDRGARLDLACLRLDACAADDTRVALGVAVLTHESVHLRGVVDEARAECEAVGRSAEVARSLGASPAAAADIADWQFSVASDRLPERYQTSADCRVPGAAAGVTGS